MKPVSVPFNNTALLLAFLITVSGCGAGNSGDGLRAQLQWDPPTTHKDGSPLSPSEIGGYRVYYGTTPGTYLDSVEVGTATSILISDLRLPAGRTYYLSITVFADGGLESDHSIAVATRIR